MILLAVAKAFGRLPHEVAAEMSPDQIDICFSYLQILREDQNA